MRLPDQGWAMCIDDTIGPAPQPLVADSGPWCTLKPAYEQAELLVQQAYALTPIPAIDPTVWYQWRANAEATDSDADSESYVSNTSVQPDMHDAYS